MGFYFFRLLSRLPFRFLYVISDVLYFLLAHVVRYRREVVQSNLRRAFPEKSVRDIQRISRLFYRNLADILVETLKLPALSEKQLKQRTRFTNPEIVRPLLARGPVLIMASHQSNWEWAPAAAQLNGFPADSVYKPLVSPFFEDLVFRIRSTFGVRPIPMHRLLREMVARQGEPRLIALVADQIPDWPENAHWIPFLHQDTAFYPGTERLARRSNLPVVYVEMIRVGRGRYELTFHLIAQPPYESLPDGAIIERYRDLLEITIRKMPSDWLWSHKRWKHQRTDYEAIKTKLE